MPRYSDTDQCLFLPSFRCVCFHRYQPGRDQSGRRATSARGLQGKNPSTSTPDGSPRCRISMGPTEVDLLLPCEQANRLQRPRERTLQVAQDSNLDGLPRWALPRDWSDQFWTRQQRVERARRNTFRDVVSGSRTEHLHCRFVLRNSSLLFGFHS